MEHSDGSLTDVLAWRRGVSVIELMAYKQTAPICPAPGEGRPQGTPGFWLQPAEQLGDWGT